MKKWTTKKVIDVSPSPWFPIEKHEVELPDGTLVDDYYLTTLQDVAMVLPFTTEGDIVLVQQYKHGQREIMIELPAGFLQKGKSPIESAIAELEEETGILVTEEQLISLGRISHIPTKSTQIVYGYLAKNLSFNSEQNLDELEDIEVLVKKPTAVLQMIKRGELWVSDSVSFILKAQLVFPELFQK